MTNQEFIKGAQNHRHEENVSDMSPMEMMVVVMAASLPLWRDHTPCLSVVSTG